MNKKGFIESALARFTWYFVFGISAVVFIVLLTLTRSQKLEVAEEKLIANDLQAQTVSWLERPMQDGRTPAELLSIYPFGQNGDTELLKSSAEEAYEGMSEKWDVWLDGYTMSVDYAPGIAGEPILLATSRNIKQTSDATRPCGMTWKDASPILQYHVAHITGTALKIKVLQCK